MKLLSKLHLLNFSTLWFKNNLYTFERDTTVYSMKLGLCETIHAFSQSRTDNFQNEDAYCKMTALVEDGVGWTVQKHKGKAPKPWILHSVSY